MTRQGGSWRGREGVTWQGGGDMAGRVGVAGGVTHQGPGTLGLSSLAPSTVRPSRISDSDRAPSRCSRDFSMLD